MNFNAHFELRDKHAFLSPSSPYWTEYDDQKLIDSYKNYQAREKGTRLHAFAAEAISLGEKLQGHSRTLSMYVNDSIQNKMQPEQTLYYSEKCYGHADAIQFRRNTLSIYDLKTGLVVPGKMRQLEVYAALFCLEYCIDPHDINIELRIYQFDQAVCYEPDPDDIEELMQDKIVRFDKILKMVDEEE